MDTRHGLFGEGQWPAQARHLHAVQDVPVCLCFVERVEMEARNHALGQLLEFGLGQNAAQFWLTYEDDLQQFSLVGFQVGQQAQLLEHVRREVLRLVNDEHIAFAPRVAGEQVGVERVEVVPDGGRTHTFMLHFNVKLAADRLQQVTDRELGIEDVGDPAVLGKLLQEAAANRGFAGTDVASEQHESAVAANAIQQVGQRFPVTLAHEQVARVRSNGKRALTEPEKCSVHAVEHTAARCVNTYGETPSPTALSVGKSGREGHGVFARDFVEGAHRALDIPRQLATFFDHHFAVADATGHLAGGVNHQLVAHGEVAVEYAPDLCNVDLRRPFEFTLFGDLDHTRVHGGFH